jgi:hypothetical protein
MSHVPGRCPAQARISRLVYRAQDESRQHGSDFFARRTGALVANKQRKYIQRRSDSNEAKRQLRLAAVARKQFWRRSLPHAPGQVLKLEARMAAQGIRTVTICKLEAAIPGFWSSASFFYHGQQDNEQRAAAAARATHSALMGLVRAFNLKHTCARRDRRW